MMFRVFRVIFSSLYLAQSDVWVLILAILFFIWGFFSFSYKSQFKTNLQLSIGLWNVFYLRVKLGSYNSYHSASQSATLST